MRRIETNHGGYTINEYEVEISQEMRNKALAFASKIKLDDNQYDRLIPREYQIEPGDDQQTIRNKARLILKYTIQRTYVGKLGELAFLVLLNEKSLPVIQTVCSEYLKGKRMLTILILLLHLMK